MVIKALKPYSFEEYCHYKDDSDNRFELVDGYLEIMTPRSFRHVLIADKLKEILNQEIKRQSQSLICLLELGIRTGWNKSRIADLAVISRSQVIESLEKQRFVKFLRYWLLKLLVLILFNGFIAINGLNMRR
ncbi:MAG: Uma2 family endonuclease [Snowella sp.]|nr:Uma2 family endonuclease [Snowella sp.]